MKTITIDFPGLSLLEIYKDNKDIWHPGNDWFKDGNFSKEKVPAGKWEVSLEPVENSTDKTWAEQQSLIPPKGYVPPAAVLVYAICEYYKQKDKHALSDLWLRTSSLDADGYHVYVGVRSECVNVYSSWDSRRDSYLGLASAWKVDAGDPDDSTLLDSSELELRIEKLERFYKKAVELIPGLKEYRAV